MSQSWAKKPPNERGQKTMALNERLKEPPSNFLYGVKRDNVIGFLNRKW